MQKSDLRRGPAYHLRLFRTGECRILRQYAYRTYARERDHVFTIYIGLIQGSDMTALVDTGMTTVERVNEIAELRRIPMAQVALAWMYAKSYITSPIIGTTKPHHLDAALAALSVNLTKDEVKRLEEPYRPHPVIAHS